MKKLLLFCAAAFAAITLSAQTAATFEDITVGADSLYRSEAPTTGGLQEWMSGDYMFATYVDAGYAPAYYYYDIAVSAKKATDFVADYSAGFDMKSAAGGAAEGENYAVWYSNWNGNAHVYPSMTTTISGMYVTNNTYAVSSMTNGDGYAKKFAADDWFKLTITGYRFDEEMQEVAGESVDFYLADFRDGKSIILTDWVWCDLTSLGEVDAISFSLSSTDNGTYGMNTPGYFCFDNLGGTAPTTPTAIEPTHGETMHGEPHKLLRNGQVLIIRGEHIYNAAGQVVR